MACNIHPCLLLLPLLLESTMPKTAAFVSTVRTLTAKSLIAIGLKELDALRVDMRPANWDTLTEAQRSRYQDLAARAEQMLSPDRTSALIDRALERVECWLNEPLPAAGPVDSLDIAREAIAQFVALQAAPRPAEAQAAPCTDCHSFPSATDSRCRFCAADAAEYVRHSRIAQQQEAR